MKFIEDIQISLGLNDAEMARLLNLRESRYYRNFKESREKVGLRNFCRLWRASGLSGDEFLERAEEEVEK